MIIFDPTLFKHTNNYYNPIKLNHLYLMVLKYAINIDQAQKTKVLNFKIDQEMARLKLLYLSKYQSNYIDTTHASPA